MLPGLRLDRLLGRDDEHDQIDPRGAGEHVLDEALVSWNIDEPDRHVTAEAEGREPDVDRDPAHLLLIEAIAVDSCEGADQLGLAVIDVARRADDDVLHGGTGGDDRAEGLLTPGCRAAFRSPPRSTSGRGYPTPGCPRGWSASA